MEDFNPTPLLKKILFVDEPFSESTTPRALRSRFIWNILCINFDADLLLLKSSAYLEKPVPEHRGYDKQYSLSLDGQKVLSPDSYHKLAPGQKERFISILDSKRYEFIVFAGLSCLPLAPFAHKALPHCKIIVDVEANNFPELENAWQANKKLENATALWSVIRQKAWDKILLSSRNHYLFANPLDAQELSAMYKLSSDRILFLPQPVSENAVTAQPAIEGKFMLFWGDTADIKNLEAAKHIVAQIYPRISKKLVEKNISVVLCGGEELKSICGGRIVHQPLSLVQELLPAALFVLLPLDNADRENRILQVAAARKALVCTHQTISGWDLPEGSCFALTDLDAVANRLAELLRAPKQLEAPALALHEHCALRYNESAIADLLIATIYAWTSV